METKLTLRLNDNVIDRAKEYARNHKVSLSKMIESYLDNITTPKLENENEKATLTPLVESLSGVIKVPNNYDYKKEYSDYLEAKYK
jgi:alcohol dehydrogenase YqhD (iron-dependent ADH family)